MFPEHRVSTQQVDLSSDRIKSAEIAPLTRKIAQRVLEFVETLGCLRASGVIDLGDKSAEIIVITPENSACSPIVIWIYRDPGVADQLVGVSAGQGVYFNVPEVPGRRDESVEDTVAYAAKAIIEGKLSERIYHAGSTQYRWVCELPTDIGVIRLDRTDFPNRIRGILKRKTLTHSVYPPYGTESSGVPRVPGAEFGRHTP